MYLTNCNSKKFLDFTQQYLFSEFEKIYFDEIFSFFCDKTYYKNKPDVFYLLEKYKKDYLSCQMFLLPFHIDITFGVEGKKYKTSFTA